MDHGLSQFERSLDAILAAQDLQQLQGVIQSFRSIYRLTNIVLHVVRVADATIVNPILLLTYPDEWVKEYTERNFFLIDPVVQVGSREFLPFDWRDVDRKSAQARQLFRKADEYGIGRQGLTLPIRGPFGERSLFSATSDLSDKAWSEYRYACMLELQGLAIYLHDRAVSLAGYRTRAQLHQLSHREGQCLQMVARGMLPKQIAAHLALSESAVRLYMRSARHKLRTKTTNQAIAKATHLELFDVTGSLPPYELSSIGLKAASSDELARR